MKDKKQVKQELSNFYFGDEAKNYDSLRSTSPSDKKLIELQKKAFRNLLSDSHNKKILDVACGTGFFFSEYGDNFIYGVDISEEMLNVAKKRKNPRVVSLTKTDASKIPFKDNYFDVVVTSKFIMHTPEYKTVFKEMIRVAKKGGFIIMDLPNKQSLSYIFTKIRILRGKIRYYNFFSKNEKKEICKSFGLSEVKEEGTTAISYRLFPKSMFFIIDAINKIKFVKENFSYVYFTKFKKL
jgi:ubiquinone/menaquinone biosynthesis C-methylase UbiE